jgi:diphthamide biosynthesis protein 4
MEVKDAYRRALLLHHPDKRREIKDETTPNIVDIDLLKEAYTTLSSEDQRTAYDGVLASRRNGPRPAHVISLSEFDENIGDAQWTYTCRCSGRYIIFEDDLENDRHLVGCDSCSEVVWVGYEAVDGDEDSS